MKKITKIIRVLPPRSSRHLTDVWLGKLAFGVDEEPRGTKGNKEKK